MAKVTGQGTKLHRESDVAGTWERIPGVVDFNGFGGQTGEVDASDLDSVEAEFLPDLSDPGQANFTINVDLAGGAGLATYEDLVADQQARTVRRWALELPAAIGTNVFIYADAYVSGSPIQGGRGAMVQSAFALRLSGARTFTDSLPGA